MSSPFQQKFMAKNPVKGFTMAEIERSTRRAEEKMQKNAEILNKQNPETGGPNYEKIEEFDHAGGDGYDVSVEKTDSPLNAYVSTAGHFQRMQDNIAAAFTPKKKTGPTSEDKKNKAMEDYYKSLTKTSEENNPFKGLTVSESDSAGLFDTDISYDPSEDYSRTFEESGKGNRYYIGQGVDKSENYFNKFGQ